MFEGWFSSVVELENYQRRRREERDARIDVHLNEFLAQLHIATELPRAELASPPGAVGSADPTSVMAMLVNFD